MRILRASDHKTTPWKNGGGTTTQICVWPPGAGLDDFDWRVSMARVASDGPFSGFAGVDRTLAVLAGEGIELRVADAPPVTLTPARPPFSFPGDAATQARLVDGPILDLNVMVRREKYGHSVTRLLLNAPAVSVMPGRQSLLLCTEGQLRIRTPEDEARLGAHDAALFEHERTHLHLDPSADTVAYLVEITGPG